LGGDGGAEVALIDDGDDAFRHKTYCPLVQHVSISEDVLGRSVKHS
jgi:hypothetical protein